MKSIVLGAAQHAFTAAQADAHRACAEVAHAPVRCA
jgi:hypothetical protein